MPIADMMQEELIRIFLLKGINGISHSELMKLFGHHVLKEELMHELDFLLEQDKIQKFMIQSTLGRPKTIYRATENILKGLTIAKPRQKRSPGRKKGKA